MRLIILKKNIEEKKFSVASFILRTIQIKIGIVKFDIIFMIRSKYYRLLKLTKKTFEISENVVGRFHLALIDDFYNKYFHQDIKS